MDNTVEVPFKIQKGIPIPAGRGMWFDRLSVVEPGDSFLVANQSQATSARTVLKKRGFGSVTRELYVGSTRASF